MAGVHAQPKSDEECPPSERWYTPYVSRILATLLVITLGIISAVGTLLIDKIESFTNRVETFDTQLDTTQNKLDETKDTLDDNTQLLDQINDKPPPVQAPASAPNVTIQDNSKAVADAREALTKAEEAQKKAEAAEKNSNKPAPLPAATPRPTPTPPKTGVCALGLCNEST